VFPCSVGFRFWLLMTIIFRMIRDMV
jgi:hypothetical protein